MRRRHVLRRWLLDVPFRLASRTLFAALLAGLLVALTPQVVLAGPSGSSGDPKEGQAQAPSGFAIGLPKGSVGFKLGFLLPRAQSDIYTFNSEQLTLDSNSYNTALFGMDVGFSIHEQVELVFGFEYSRSAPVSEFRDFVDEFDTPITQRTRLTQVPLNASIRLYLTDRGRAVGSYAWVPKKAVPYVGGGGGFMWWRYEQFGDFVDFVDFSIFTEHFLTEGWEPSLHAFGGMDLSLTPRLALTFEGRYTWASGQLAPAFSGFEPIDLAGFRGTGGVTYRF